MKKRNLLRASAMLLAVLMFVSACSKGGGKTDKGDSADPYTPVTIKKLSEITSATDPEYADALVAEMELYADSLITTGNVKYEEKEELADISKKFPAGKVAAHPHTEFEFFAGDGFVKSGLSSINENWAPKTAADSKVFALDLKKDYDIESVTVKWSGKRAAKGQIQVSDDNFSWYNVGKTFVLSGTKNKEMTVEINETHRRYIRVYFATNIDIASVSSVIINGFESNPTAEIPKGPATNGVDRPIVYPIADSVEGVKNPVISLAGTWKYNVKPQAKFWENNADISEWKDVPVPGDPDNLNIGNRTEYKEVSLSENYPTAFKLRTTIPADYKDKEILLHFDGVTTYARIFVNGQLVRTHRNGTTAFDCLITDYVEPGKDAIITVEATAEIFSSELPYYQGIVGYPKLMAVPKESICRLQYETDLDASYKNATLTVSASEFTRGKAGGKIKIELFDPEGKPVALANDSAAFTGVSTDTIIKNDIKDIKAYSDEHPNLYTLKAYMLSSDGKKTEQLTKKVGFKEIEKVGNKVLVNGQETKLHGVNWQNLSPTGGLVADYWSDRASLIKLAAANVNFIRTAHHQQYSYVLDICDELGIYVEEEAAISFVCVWNETYYERIETLVNPKYSNWYMNQYAEMVEKSRSHASLLYYSLGNESSWGTNVQAGHDYVMAVDGKHLTKFSWGKLQPNENSTDIFSVHYPTNADLYYNPVTSVPYVYDEYTHVLGHVPATYYNDPSILTHWDLEKQWDVIYNQDGGLGGAIWNGRDQASITPTGMEKYFVRYWGILDTWNREKEEYWITKKAYSPIQIDEKKTYEAPAAGAALIFEVENRYRHTNLKDLKLECTVNGKAVEVQMPDIPIKTKGNISIKGDFKKGDVVRLVFRNDTGRLPDYIVDEYEFVLGGRQATQFAAVSTGAAPTIDETDSTITVKGDKFEIIFDKATGKVSDGKYNGKTTIIGGPELNLGRHIAVNSWALKSINAKQQGSEAVVSVSGDYKQVKGVVFNIKIDSTGRINTEFTVNLPSGKLEEIGVKYTLTEMKTMKWSSDVYKFSLWPQASVARAEGTTTAYRKTDKVISILEKPTWYRNMSTTTLGIEDDGTRLTDDFRARRMNLFYETVTSKDGISVTFESNGKGCAKITSTGKDDKTVDFGLGCVWGYHDSEGEFAAMYNNPISGASGSYTGSIVLRLSEEK